MGVGGTEGGNGIVMKAAPDDGMLSLGGRLVSTLMRVGIPCYIFFLSLISIFQIPNSWSNPKWSHFRLPSGLIRLWNVWLIVWQLPVKAGWWDAPLMLQNFSWSNKQNQSEVVTLGLNFVLPPSTSTHHLIQKSASQLTQTIKKQFHFKDHPLTIKSLKYYKPSTWVLPDSNSTNLPLFLEKI